MTKTLASIALGFLLLTGAAGSLSAPPSFVAASHASASVRVASAAAAAAQDSDTETVLSTFRPRAGKEDELLKTMGENWSTLRKLGLVLQEPHLVLRGKDDGGKTIFVEILTWRDHEAADHVPAEVQMIWNHLQALVEQRNGHSGIEFPEFEIVTP
jgi:flagellar motor component MotA